MCNYNIILYFCNAAKSIYWFPDEGLPFKSCKRIYCYFSPWINCHITQSKKTARNVSHFDIPNCLLLFGYSVFMPCNISCATFLKVSRMLSEELKGRLSANRSLREFLLLPTRGSNLSRKESPHLDSVANKWIPFCEVYRPTTAWRIIYRWQKFWLYKINILQYVIVIARTSWYGSPSLNCNIF